MATLQQYIDYLFEQVSNHSIYVWGGQGQNHTTITEAWIRKMETSATNANRAIAYWKKQKAAGYEKKLRAFDCSGLGMYFLQNLHGMVSGDMNSGTMRSNCTTLARSQLKRGDWVFRKNASGIYHIGYIVDDNLNVIESMGRDNGVVKRALNASGSSYWNDYGRPKWFKAEIEKGGGTMTGSWQKDKKGHWYKYADGSYLKSKWAQLPYSSTDKTLYWFYFDAKGYMVSSAWQGNYYLMGNGVMATNAYIKAKKGYCWVGKDGKWNGKYYQEGFKKGDLVIKNGKAAFIESVHPIVK